MPFVLIALLAFFQSLTGQVQNSLTPPNTQYSDIDEEVFYHLRQQDMEELNRLSKLRQEMLKNREEALKAEKEGILRVGILGNSALKYTKEGFNGEVLRQLFEEMGIEGPEAVFFLGPFVPEGVSIDLFYEKIKSSLGNIPFYPTPDSPEIIEKFQLPVSKEYPKGYSVTLKNSLFALFSGDGDTQEPLYHWLENTLQGQRGRYRFLMGPDAAFSTQATEGSFKGLDRWTQFRNKFWNLLRTGNVAAYFASNEILYDRSYRSGVWQLLTGGAGATRTYAMNDDTFYHFIMLTVPQNDEGPKIEVYDIRGRKRDSVLLNSQSPAISQFRINTLKN